MIRLEKLILIYNILLNTVIILTEAVLMMGRSKSFKEIKLVLLLLMPRQKHAIQNNSLMYTHTLLSVRDLVSSVKLSWLDKLWISLSCADVGAYDT